MQNITVQPYVKINGEPVYLSFKLLKGIIDIYASNNNIEYYKDTVRVISMTNKEYVVKIFKNEEEYMNYMTEWNYNDKNK